MRKSLAIALSAALLALGFTTPEAKAADANASRVQLFADGQNKSKFSIPSDMKYKSSHNFPNVETIDGINGEKRAANLAKTVAALSTTKISYHGGPNGVVTGTPKVYIVFWGNDWGTATASNNNTRLTFSNDPQRLAPYLEDFIAGLGTNGETWSKVMNQYCDSNSSATVLVGATSCPGAATSAGAPSTSGALAGIWYDNSAANPTSSSGSANLAADEAALAQEAIYAAHNFSNNDALSNASAQYIIVSPTGKHPDGFNTPQGGFCAWHNASTSSSLGVVAYTNLPYIPNAGTSCGANYVPSAPSASLQGVSIVEGHEYAETISDMKILNNVSGMGWYDNISGGENGDLCAWSKAANASGTLTTATGSFAVQGSWSNVSSGCAMTTAYPTITSVSPLTPSVGQSILISGTNLSGAFSVSFSSNNAGTVNAVPTGITATSFSVTVPTGAVSGPVLVTTPGGVAVSGSITVNTPAVAQAAFRISNTASTGFVGTPIQLTVSGGSGTGSVSYSVSGSGCSITSPSQLSATSATICTVTATKAASAGFLAAVASKIFSFSLPVNQAVLTITPNNSNIPKGTSGITLSVSGGSGNGGVTYSSTNLSCRISGTRLTVATSVTPGSPVSCPVIAVKAASPGYLAATSAIATFTFVG